MKKFLEEFKVFIMRGNVMDLAVAVIIGGAFQSIINSLVNDMIMPVISLITGGIDFSNWFFQLGGGEKAATLDAARNASAGAVIAYGSFITAVINFLIMALVIFSLVKALNKLMALGHRKEEEAAEPTTKKCPFCMSDIDINATRCPHCTSQIAADAADEAAASAAE